MDIVRLLQSVVTLSGKVLAELGLLTAVLDDPDCFLESVVLPHRTEVCKEETLIVGGWKQQAQEPY